MRRSQKPARRRITVALPPELDAVLTRLSGQEWPKSTGEVILNALRVYDWMSRTQQAVPLLAVDSSAGEVLVYLTTEVGHAAPR